MYNLTFTDLADKSGFCYCWDQTVARRGSNEIGSYINMHLKENIMESEVTETILFRRPKTWELVPDQTKPSKSLLEFKNKIKYWKLLGCTCKLCKTNVSNLGCI